MDKKRILFCGTSFKQETGLAYVALSFLKRFFLTKNYDLAYCNIIGDDVDYNDLVKIYGLEFTKSIQPHLALFNVQISNPQKALTFDEEVIQRVNPDIVISFLDPWHLEQISLSKYIDSFMWVSYLTVETPRYPNILTMPNPVNPAFRKNLVDIFKKADVIVPVTKMGKGALEYLNLKPIDNIYNGLDFSKVGTPNRQVAFQGKVKDTDFVFMTMGRNNERKKIETSLYAFAGFLKKVKDPDKYRIYLHTNVNEIVGGTDLISVIKELDIEKHFIGFDASKNRNFPRELLYERYASVDCYIALPAGEGFCHPKETSLLTDKGIKNIENFKKDDIVITHKGNKKKVLDTTYRNFRGYMYEITAVANLPLKLTENHPMFFVKNNKRFSCIKEKDLLPDWYPIEELKKDDLIALPKIKKTSKSIEKIKITDYVDNLNIDENDNVYFKMSKKTLYRKDSLKTIAKRFDCAFQTVHKIINKPSYKSILAEEVRNYVMSTDYKVPDSVKCKNEIELTEDVMKFFGLYIAEGSCGKNSINFSFHKDEINLHNLVIEVGKKLFGNIEICQGKIKDSNSYHITFSSKSASKLMEHLFGKGAVNKKIPVEFFNSINIGSLIWGYFKGDGCLKGCLTAKTISKTLSFNLYHILNINNIYLSIHKQKPSKSYSNKILNKNGLIIGKHSQYILNIYRQFEDRFFNFTKLNYEKEYNQKTNRKQTYIKETEDYFFIPIKNIKKERVEEKVYNLHVEDDESYIAEGYSSHNCYGMAESMMHKKPCIYIDYGGHAEYLKGVGLPVPVKTTFCARNLPIFWALPDYDVAVEQMLKVAENEELRKEMGNKGYNFAKKEFPWEVVGEKLINVVEKHFENFHKPSFNLKRIV